MTLKEQATQNLKDFKEILDELEITFWLDGGTLLGAYRDKDFCLNDEDDTDLCTWDNYLPTRVEIVKRAIDIGFNLLHEWELEICLHRGGARVDLFFNKKNGKEAYTHIYAGPIIHKFVVIPVKYYEKLEPIMFKGEEFLAPSPVEEFLTLKYGDWKTPIHRSQYRCDNSNQNKFIRDSYV
jgi:phosphorylcholine metabolism protein LicD